MLAPTDRGSVYDALRPPPGHSLDLLVACTYSAALDTVLSLPAAMVASTLGAPSARATFGPAELAALRRVCDRTAIFCQAGAIHPAAMLPPALVEVEPMMHEVAAPRGGTFHPKLWVMRFEDERQRAIVRVAVLSRNLTGDRSWDLGLLVDGRPTGTSRRSAVADLLRLLPGWSRQSLTQGRIAFIEKLARDVERTRWRMPDGMGSPKFQALGIGPGATWVQPSSERLLVLSPFLTSRTVEALASTTTEPVAIISRSDALDRCWPASARFGRRMVLSPPEDGVGTTFASLHGKAPIWQRGRKTIAAVGSMNATCAATRGRNVEFMATFDCTVALGEAGFDGLLGHEALGAVVQDYEPAEPDNVPADAFDEREARVILCDADLARSGASSPVVP